MTWTILVLILGIALYVFNGKLVKQDPKKASAKSEYMKKAQPEMERIEKKYAGKDQNDQQVMLQKSQEMMMV